MFPLRLLVAVGQGLGVLCGQWPQMIERAATAALDFDIVGNGSMSSLKQKG
uniref:hypothetical protein n=1 Tax=Rhizobium sp. CFBP 8762 TaxID=2775279 RepID=UPI001FD14F13|nr:hypothetical protein [Rhizobium sp. CFBP 8762]